MHRKTLPAALLTTSLLTGCKEHLLTLEFDRSVVVSAASGNEHGIDSGYADDIRSVLEDQGLDPANIELALDDGSTHAIQIRGSLEPEQIKAAEAAFSAYVDRKPVPLSATITTIASEQATDATSQANEASTKEIPVTFILDDVVLTYTKKPPQKSGNPFTDSLPPPRSDTLAVGCNVSVKLTGEHTLSSFNFTGFGAVMAALVPGINWAVMSESDGPEEYAASLLFDNEALQTSYENNALSFTADAAAASTFYGRMGPLLGLGSVDDSVWITDGGVSPERFAELENACRAKAVALGEPYSSALATRLTHLTTVRPADR
ncbi:hypothetical protein [Pseudomonas sp. Marseille-QA0892]